MSMFLFVAAIFKNLSISLGVGCSTLAITNFFVAIADGVIDETERRMMGVVYVVLRVAMVLILVTTLILITYEYSMVGLANLTAFSFGQLLALFVLYLNALLMTAHLVPSTIGPALQGGSWYTLGVLASLGALGATDFTFTQFLIGYLAGLVFAVGLVNGIMAILKAKKESAS